MQNEKRFGHVSTPNSIVNAMVDFVRAEIEEKKEINVLEPGCGSCPYLKKIREINPNACLHGIEKNPEFIAISEEERKNINIIVDDYLLHDFNRKFDVIIGNPPYGIPSHNSHYKLYVDEKTKNEYKNKFSTWFGKYNLYGAFIEKSIVSLEENGKLMFVTPGTFLFLDEFKKLRKFLSENGETKVYYVGKNAFGENVNVSVVFLFFEKSKLKKGSFSLHEFENFKEIIKNENWKGEEQTFVTEKTKKLDADSIFLGDIFHVFISPRTSEIKKWSFATKEKKDNQVFLLNSKNLFHKKIEYEINYSGYFIGKKEIKNIKKFYEIPHLVFSLGRKNDGKYAMAFDEKCYPWIGDVYHLILKKSWLFLKNKIEEKIINYFYAEGINGYIDDKYRDLTYHISKSQIEKIPIPKKYCDI